MASTGAGRGFIYSKDDFGEYRVIFTLRQVSGNHQPCVLIFTQRPAPGAKPLDALGAIQFQPPNGGHWDYRPGHNNSGGKLFTKVASPGINIHQWALCEMLVHASTGEARMACCQLPAGATRCKAVEVLRFKDPTAGRKGPFAIQMHNGGIKDEYKDIHVEENPVPDDFITTK